MHTFLTFLIIVFLLSTLSSQQDIVSVKDVLSQTKDSDTSKAGTGSSQNFLMCDSETITFEFRNPYTSNGIDGESFSGELPVSPFSTNCRVGDFEIDPSTGLKPKDKIRYYDQLPSLIHPNNVTTNYPMMYTYFHANEFLKTIPEIRDQIMGSIYFRIGFTAGVSYNGTEIIFENETWQKDISGAVTGVTAYLFRNAKPQQNTGLIVGTSDFIAQLYKWENTETNTHNVFTGDGLPGRKTDNENCYDRTLSFAHNAPVWSTLLMKIHTDVINDYNISIAMAFESMEIFIESDGQVQAAEKLYSLIKEPDFGLNQTQICAIRTIITDHYKCLNPSSLRPKLDDIADYYIADDTSDNGTEPNPSNTSEWESPAIINRQNNDGLFENQAAVANVENTLYVEITNKGCDTLTDAVLQVYYALSETGLSWADAWVENVITVGSSTIMAGDKIAEIAIPSITSQYIRIPITWTPPDIESLNVPNSKINILARIVSADDVMSEVEVKDVRTNVRNNNNVGWKVLNLVK